VSVGGGGVGWWGGGVRVMGGEDVGQGRDKLRIEGRYGEAG